MANTYTQLYFHIVFAVRGRRNLMSKKWRDELYKYITGVIKAKEQKLMIIGGVEDHIHLLLGTKPDCNLSDLVRDIKANSSKWINEQKLTPIKFEWQSGFGAFTIGQSQISRVVTYIQNQEEHHKKKTFREEYIEFLKAYEVDYNEKYIFTDEE